MTASTADPIELMEQAPLSALQLWVIACTVFLNALDGFDLLSISFAAPGIAAEWQVARAELGAVLAMELVGMGIGALLIGGIADRKGRKFATLLCLTLMFIGMQAAVYATNIGNLSLFRVVTGVGLGGMLSVNNALVSEFSNRRRRQISISLMVIGFSVGGVVGGFAATQLLVHFDWRSVFQFGAIVTLLTIPVIAFTVPESVHWLCRVQPENGLGRLNGILDRLRLARITAWPRVEGKKPAKSRLKDIFAARVLRGTFLITCVYVFHAVTFYFTLKWAPKIVTDLGYHPSTAGTVLVWGNVGGIFGGIFFGFVAQRFGIKRTFVSVLVLAGLTVILFGNTATSLFNLSFFNALNGFFCVAGVAGTYASMAVLYPTEVRGFGTGFTLGVGRGGAILSPVLAGLLFSLDLDLPSVSWIMALGSVLAALLVLGLPLGKPPRAPS